MHFMHISLHLREITSYSGGRHFRHPSNAGLNSGTHSKQPLGSPRMPRCGTGLRAFRATHRQFGLQRRLQRRLLRFCFSPSRWWQSRLATAFVRGAEKQSRMSTQLRGLLALVLAPCHHSLPLSLSTRSHEHPKRKPQFGTSRTLGAVMSSAESATQDGAIFLKQSTVL